MDLSQAFSSDSKNALGEATMLPMQGKARDEERPKCRRCRERNLHCTRPAKKTVFRNSTAPLDSTSWSSTEVEDASAFHTPAPLEQRPPSVPAANGQLFENSPPRASPAKPSEPQQSPPALGYDSAPADTRFPLQDPQEACLLRYFIEDLAHWFDLCDEQRHFQLVVPIRARQNPPLLYAIFAVAARHLTRLPQFKTPGGILYQGQLLPRLTPHDAVEYTLRCIPALRDFHLIQDDERLESIIATAVILRQLEEIDDEDEEDDRPGTGEGSKVNFLAIIDAVLRSPPSQNLFGRRGLVRAAYWMALRQEIYHSFTRRHPPQMILDASYGAGASLANRIVLHAAQVAKWRWADGSAHEWQRLQTQGARLEREAAASIQPIYDRPAERASGEIFPTTWYSSVVQVTSMQLSTTARMVLTAEDPSLRSPSTSRARWREVEDEVRQMLLSLCGLSLCHPACPPALLHAAVGMELYGDFFTDRYERQALRGVVDKFRDARAWPVKKLSAMFQ